MTTVERSLGPEGLLELSALYRTHGWWADREAEDLRRALAATDETVALREASGREDASDLVAAARPDRLRLLRDGLRRHRTRQAPGGKGSERNSSRR